MMLKDFPKTITTMKLNRGHYRIVREDGYSIEVRSSVKGDWYQLGNMARRETLSVFQSDMKRGYMSRDQVVGAGIGEG